MTKRQKWLAGALCLLVVGCGTLMEVGSTFDLRKENRAFFLSTVVFGRAVETNLDEGVPLGAAFLDGSVKADQLLGKVYPGTGWTYNQLLAERMPDGAMDAGAIAFEITATIQLYQALSGGEPSLGLAGINSLSKGLYTYVVQPGLIYTRPVPPVVLELEEG